VSLTATGSAADECCKYEGSRSFPLRVGLIVHWRPQRHSSSASHRTAGAAGFLTLTHCLDRPERYAEPIRFDTMPSQLTRSSGCFSI
jgi:hypothetical protein